MDSLTFETLFATFSKARISTLIRQGDTPKAVLQKYNTNVSLNEAMMPILHYIEICLRNHFDRIIKELYSPNWLLLSQHYHTLHISERDQSKIQDIISKVRKANKREPIHDDIIAQMNFGFWCSFLHKKYDPILWHKKNVITSAFPNIKRSNRTRSHIEHQLLKIKELRNRIAHHEPITNYLDSYLACQKLLAAMSTNAVQMLKEIDRFPLVSNTIS